MSDNITILSEGNESPQRFDSKEDYIGFISKVHGQKAAGIQKLIDKEDWSLMQRFFTNKQLVKIARDQRIIQTQRGFNLINRCEEIINDVIITSLENRAKSVLMQDLFKDKTDDIRKMLQQLLILKKDIRSAEKDFSNFYVEEKDSIKIYENDKDLYTENLNSIVEMRKNFFKAGREQLEYIHKDLSEIEKKISR